MVHHVEHRLSQIVLRESAIEHLTFLCSLSVPDHYWRTPHSDRIPGRLVLPPELEKHGRFVSS